MDPVVHFELPAEDRQRMSDFYAAVFGWQTQLMGEDMANYVVVKTTETGDDNRPTTPGAINGGFFMKSDDNHTPTVVVGVKDINESVKKVAESGGKPLGHPVDIPGVGLYISFVDTEGNKIAMLQPK